MLPVPKYRFSEPRHNLPGRKGVATAEDRFTIGFARAYHAQALSLHSGTRKTELTLAREIPVNGFGITDLITVSWAPVSEESETVLEFAESVRPTTRAFEAKMTDWKAGLTQATRYRFFAHQSILVLPPQVCSKALEFLDTFRKTRIGLWSFDPKTGRITAFYTPRPITPKSMKYHCEALQKVNRATKGVLPTA